MFKKKEKKVMGDDQDKRSPLDIELDNLRAQPSDATVSISHIIKIIELLAK